VSKRKKRERERKREACDGCLSPPSSSPCLVSFPHSLAAYLSARRRRRFSLVKRQAKRRQDEGDRGTCERRKTRDDRRAHDASYTKRIYTPLDEHVSTTSTRRARDKDPAGRGRDLDAPKTQSRPCALGCSSSWSKKAKDATRDTRRACEGQRVVEQAARGARGGVADLCSTSPKLKKTAKSSSKT